MPLIKRLLISLTAIAAVCALAASSALASTGQVSIVQDNNAINANPMAALTKMKALGFSQVKYVIYWNEDVPNPTSTRAPANVASASTYDNYFGLLDEIDTDAQKVGIKLGFMVTGGAPRWAEGSSGCNSGQIAQSFTCRPSDADFGDFVAALGARYNGANGHPAVRWWSIWNEPNYIPNLSPQATSSDPYEGATLYRGLLDAGWSNLKKTGHTANTDTILFGEVAPRGISGGNAEGGGAPFSGQGSKPVSFLAALYCETVSGKRFSGRTASENNCGTAGSFKTANPALFGASGVADHPYSQGVAPSGKTGDCRAKADNKVANIFCPASASHPADPLWTDLGSISNLENGLARDLKTYGSTRKYAIWSTEYGYWMTPPSTSQNSCHSATQADCAVSQAHAAAYLNQAEYISYENPRIASFDQYQLYDPSIGPWFDGLLTRAGAVKPVFDAYELPLFLPTTSVRAPSNLTVWGGVRPAAYDAAHVKGLKPMVKIQFKAKSGGYKTVKTLAVNLKSPGGYFDTKVRFTASGSVRLLYTAGKSTLASRVQAITVG
jgi:hypothetical protein